MEPYHSILLFHIWRYQIMQEEKCFGIDGYKNMIFEFGYETTVDQGLFNWKCKISRIYKLLVVEFNFWEYI